MATPGPERAETMEGLYDELRPILRFIACVKFRIPECDAEQLIHDAALVFLTSRKEIEKPRAWLVAVMSNTCRYYWRRRGSRDAIESPSIDEIEEPARESAVRELECQVIAREVLARVPPRDREILRLHYFERLTETELAVRLETTRGYARNLIARALRRARGLFEELPRLPILDPQLGDARELPDVVRDEDGGTKSPGFIPPGP